jgi:hypothetical protein
MSMTITASGWELFNRVSDLFAFAAEVNGEG